MPRVLKLHHNVYYLFQIPIPIPTGSMVLPACFFVQPPPQKLLPEHAQTLERYAWESFDPHSQGECTWTIIGIKHMNYVPFLFTGTAENVQWILWVTFIWSGVNTDLVRSFSDLPAWECFPAPAVSSGEFHHPHSCTVHRISWTFLSQTGKMMVFMAFIWQGYKYASVCLLLPFVWFFFGIQQHFSCISVPRLSPVAFLQGKQY